MHAFDPREEAVAGGRERQWTAVGMTELVVICKAISLPFDPCLDRSGTKIV